MQNPIPPTLDPAADEKATKTGKAIVATIVAIALLAGGIIAVLLFRNFSKPPVQIETPPTTTPHQATLPATPSPSPTPTTLPEWQTVNTGLPDELFSAINYRIMPCDDVLYLYAHRTTATRFYVLEDFRWVPETSYETYVGDPLPAILSVYAYDDMLFVDTPEQTHIKRADGSWFSLPRFQWLEAGTFSRTLVAGHGEIDGLYVMSARHGKILRFENEAWTLLPDIPEGIFPATLDPENEPYMAPYAWGKNLYLIAWDYRLFQLSSTGWDVLFTIPSDGSVWDFEGELHMITPEKIFRWDAGNWREVIDSITGDTFSFEVHDGKLYAIADHAIYRKDGSAWTPLMQGLPTDDSMRWSLYPVEGGLFLSGHFQNGETQGYYRLGTTGWEQMTGAPWDTDKWVSVHTINGMNFVHSSKGHYRLSPDGTTTPATERTIQHIVPVGSHDPGYLNVFAYQDGYIEMPFCPYIYFHRAGQAMLLQDGLPLGDPAPVAYYQAGQDVYAICHAWNSSELFHWKGGHWEKLSDVQYHNSYSATVFQDALYIRYGDNLYCVIADKVIPTLPLGPDDITLFTQEEGTLLLDTGSGRFRLVDATTWVPIKDAPSGTAD